MPRIERSKRPVQIAPGAAHNKAVTAAERRSDRRYAPSMLSGPEKPEKAPSKASSKRRAPAKRRSKKAA